jgi:hypothetical protein
VATENSDLRVNENGALRDPKRRVVSDGVDFSRATQNISDRAWIDPFSDILRAKQALRQAVGGFIDRQRDPVLCFHVAEEFEAFLASTMRPGFSEGLQHHHAGRCTFTEDHVRAPCIPIPPSFIQRPLAPDLPSLTTAELLVSAFRCFLRGPEPHSI